MSDERKIRGDLDGVYDDPNAECHKITSYIYSKGDIETNSISNKFYNIEILTANRLFYLVKTSGRLGGKDNHIVVRRLNSSVIVEKLYLEECKKVLSEGYNEVEVISIYPNCSEAAKNYVAKKNVISKDEAKDIALNSKAKIEEKSNTPKVKPEIDLHPKVLRLVDSIYIEANQTIKKSLNPESFKRSDTPLGMINLNMINKGRELLNIISESYNKLLSVKTPKTIEKYRGIIIEHSNMYNSTIPRVLKRGSDSWLLNTGDKIMEQYELLDILELGLSNAVLNSNYTVDVNSKYNSLNSDILYVSDKETISMIKEKMEREQLQNHNFRTKLINVFEVNQKNAPNFDSSCGNVVSLFHGTRGANLLGIISTHIKLPHNLGSNVQLTGSMFGSGVYFGEYSKSLQYSTARFGGVRNKSNSYYLFLCDVALGKIKMELHAKNYSSAPTGFHSVMGVGEDAFRQGCNIMGINGPKNFSIPKSVFQKSFGRTHASLLYNEFIVYNQNRYKIRYIVEVEER